MPRHVVTHPRTEPTCAAPRHGTLSAHRYGCHCPEAREKKRLRDKRSREHRYCSPLIEGVGTARRVRALSAIGWRYGDIAERLDCTWQYVQRLAKRTSRNVHVRTATHVAHLYRELKDTPGPSSLTASRAAAKGWQSPQWWDAWEIGVIDLPDPDPDPVLVDEVLVLRAVAGQARWGQLNLAEREGACRRLLAKGMGRNAIARHLHASSTVIGKFLNGLDDQSDQRAA